MSSYNVRLYRYADSVQLRIYNRPFISNEAVRPVKEPAGISEQLFCSDVRTQDEAERCQKSSKSRTVQEMYEITRANRWSYFVTLTFDPKKIDSTDYDLLSCKTSKWLNNLKSRYAPDLKYILVPELHKDGKKFHFHALIANTGNLQLSFSGKVAVGKRIYDYHRKPFGTKIYNLSNWKYGFSTATAVSDSSRVASYITKYITNDLCTLTKGKKRYWVSKNVDRAEISYMTLAYEDIQTIIQNNLSSVGHMSTCRVSDAGLEVMFIEINGGVLI